MQKLNLVYTHLSYSLYDKPYEVRFTIIHNMALGPSIRTQVYLYRKIGHWLPFWNSRGIATWVCLIQGLLHVPTS